MRPARVNHTVDRSLIAALSRTAKVKDYVPRPGVRLVESDQYR